MLTYEKVIDVWQKNGAVVAKLFSWLRNKESSLQEGEGDLFDRISKSNFLFT